jgi:hypothetical protein
MKRFPRFTALTALAGTLVLLTAVTFSLAGCDPGARDETPVATPSADPAAGAIIFDQSITLATATSGAAIRYTIDGTTPTLSNGIWYTYPFSLNRLRAAPVTVKAIAYKAGMPDSAIMTASYTRRASITRWLTVGLDENPPYKDGAIIGYCTAELQGDTFVERINATAAYLTISGIPAGLTLVALWESPTKVTFSLTGNAIAHARENSTRFGVTFKDAAFTSGNASTIGYTSHSIPVNFYD